MDCLTLDSAMPVVKFQGYSHQKDRQMDAPKVRQWRSNAYYAYLLIQVIQEVIQKNLWIMFIFVVGHLAQTAHTFNTNIFNTVVYYYKNLFQCSYKS